MNDTSHEINDKSHEMNDTFHEMNDTSHEMIIHLMKIVQFMKNQKKRSNLV